MDLHLEILRPGHFVIIVSKVDFKVHCALQCEVNMQARCAIGQGLALESLHRIVAVAQDDHDNGPARGGGEAQEILVPSDALVK